MNSKQYIIINNVGKKKDIFEIVLLPKKNVYVSPIIIMINEEEYRNKRRKSLTDIVSNR